MRRPLFAAGVLIVAACAPPYDAAPSPVEDGGSGADAGEGGPEADAGADVPIVPAAQFCSVPRAGQVFCEDFETEKLSFGFTERQEDGAAIAATRLNVLGRGFVLSYEANGAASINTWFRFSPPAASKNLQFASLKLTMDVAIATQAVTGVVVAGIWLNPLPAAAPIVHGLALNGSPELQASQDGIPSGVPRPITLGAWQTIIIELRNVGPGYVRHVSIGGQEVDVKSAPMPSNGEWDVRIGAYYGTQGSLTMLIDNVVVTRE